MEVRKRIEKRNAPRSLIIKQCSDPSLILEIEDVDINEHCMGTRWNVGTLDDLAKIIVIIAMGQAMHAARIISKLLPPEPVINKESLRADAKRALSIRGDTEEKRKVSRFHRDGLIFEIISWIAAKMSNKKALLRDPHVKSTTQGLDGLMIELDDDQTVIIRATIFEDKCSEDPRRVFHEEIMPAFLKYHNGERASELLAAAAPLLKTSNLCEENIVAAATRILDKEYRAYRGCLATTLDDDCRKRRMRIFQGFESLGEISESQRIGGVLVTGENLRAWFDDVAMRAIAYIDSLGRGEV